MIYAPYTTATTTMTDITYVLVFLFRLLLFGGEGSDHGYGVLRKSSPVRRGAWMVLGHPLDYVDLARYISPQAPSLM